MHVCGHEHEQVALTDAVTTIIATQHRVLHPFSYLSGIAASVLHHWLPPITWAEVSGQNIFHVNQPCHLVMLPTLVLNSYSGVITLALLPWHAYTGILFMIVLALALLPWHAYTGILQSSEMWS